MNILTFFEAWLRCHPANSSPPLTLSFTSITDHLRMGGVLLAVVLSPAQCQSGFQSVSGPGVWRVQGVAGSQSGPLSRSFKVDCWRCTDLGKFLKRTASSWIGIFQFRPCQSLAIGLKVRSNFISPGL